MWKMQTWRFARDLLTGANLLSLLTATGRLYVLYNNIDGYIDPKGDEPLINMPASVARQPNLITVCNCILHFIAIFLSNINTCMKP